MATSAWLTRTLLAAGLASSVASSASFAWADEHHEDRDDHREHGDRDNRGRVDRDDHDEHGRYAGRDWRHDDEHEHHGFWGPRGFPFGWGGGPSINIGPPAPYVPPPRYEPPYDYRAPYLSPSPYDYGPRGYDPGYGPGYAPGDRYRGYYW